MGAKAEEPKPSSASLYVGREAIQKEQQARPAAATLYAMPAQAMSSAGAVSVTNLSQLAASTGALGLGGKLGSTAASVEINGAMDFCMFLNGVCVDVIARALFGFGFHAGLGRPPRLLRLLAPPSLPPCFRRVKQG